MLSAGDYERLRAMDDMLCRQDPALAARLGMPRRRRLYRGSAPFWLCLVLASVLPVVVTVLTVLAGPPAGLISAGLSAIIVAVTLLAASSRS